MRADRLVRLMMLLQESGRLTVPELARRLEVSERTVHRDLDALSTSGVPVFATRGAKGGVSLLEGWKTKVTGLTRAEIHALSAIGAPGALDDLELSKPLRSGLVKLAASLPTVQRATAEHARQRLLVDPSPFFGEREPVPHLEALREAAWLNRKVAFTYRDFDGRSAERVVDPWALVVKADRWYLVAGTERGPRVFRGSRIERATVLEEAFTRPEGFDLPSFWQDWCRRFSEKRASYPVTLRCTAAGEEALAAIRPPSDGERMKRVRRRGGVKTVEIDFERETIAVGQLCLVPEGVEVLAPERLRERLHSVACALQRACGG